MRTAPRVVSVKIAKHRANQGLSGITQVTISKVLTALVLLLISVPGLTLAADNAKRLNQLVPVCLSCHGVEKMPAVGSEPYSVPRIGLQQRRYLVNALNAFKTGERKNAVMQMQVQSLSESDINMLARYFAEEENIEKQNAGVPIRSHTHPRSVEETCHACHGETGLGIIKEMPAISHQYEDYIIHAFNDYRSGVRKSAAMTAIAKGLDDAEIKTVAAYYSMQSQLHALTTPQTPAARAIKSIEMVDIPGGEFMMGVDPTDDLMPGQPKHRVNIRPFRIGKTAVTFEQYDAFAIDSGKPMPGDEGWGRSDRPVININWADTQAFIAWLNKKAGRHFRLPTEAEREYATAAGTSTDYWWGNANKLIDQDYRNGRGIAGRDQWKFTAPVGQFPANPFGVYDLVGNVFERVADCWHSSYLGAPTDGSAWRTSPCVGHVLRGGYWDTPGNANFTRSRAAMADDIRSVSLGFRLAEDK